MTDPVADPNSTQASHSPLSLVVRLFWLIFGNFVLILCAIRMLFGEAGAGLSVIDAVYWVTVALLVVARYVDVTRLGGATSDGKPSTLADFRVYTAKLVASTVAAWVVLHGITYALHA